MTLRKTNYIGVVKASWIVGKHREAKIAFHDFTLTANVGLEVESGERYQIELRRIDDANAAATANAGSSGGEDAEGEGGDDVSESSYPR